MLGRRTSFWLAVAGVSILSNFGLQLAAEKLPSLGLARFANFTKGA